MDLWFNVMDTDYMQNYRFVEERDKWSISFSITNIIINNRLIFIASGSEDNKKRNFGKFWLRSFTRRTSNLVSSSHDIKKLHIIYMNPTFHKPSREHDDIFRGTVRKFVIILYETFDIKALIWKSINYFPWNWKVLYLERYSDLGCNRNA